MWEAPLPLKSSWTRRPAPLSRDLSHPPRARAAGDASAPRRWSIPFAQPSRYSQPLHGTSLPFTCKTPTLRSVQTGTCLQAMSPAGRNAYGSRGGSSATKRAVFPPKCNRHVAKCADLASPLKVGGSAESLQPMRLQQVTDSHSLFLNMKEVRSCPKNRASGIMDTLSPCFLEGAERGLLNLSPPF